MSERERECVCERVCVCVCVCVIERERERERERDSAPAAHVKSSARSDTSPSYFFRYIRFLVEGLRCTLSDFGEGSYLRLIDFCITQLQAREK